MRTRAPRALFAVFAAVAVSFVTSTVISDIAERGVRDDAATVATNAEPSVEHLAASRTTLRHLEVQLDELLYANRTDVPRLLAAIEENRAEMQREVQAYLQIPYFPGERELWTNVSDELQALEGGIDRLLLEARAGDLTSARDTFVRDVRPAIARSSDGIHQSIEFNANKAASLARNIEEHRTMSLWLVYGLDGISVLLTAFGALLTLRLFRRYNAELQRRSDEMEQFAGRVAHDIRNPLGVIRFAVGATRDSLPPDHPAQRTLERGARGIGRVQRMIDGLLELAQAGSPAAGLSTAVRPVIVDVLEDLHGTADDARVMLKLELPERDEVVACSAGALTSLLLNLVKNAIKYTRGAPVRRVVLRVRDAEAPDLLRFEVEDTGPGVPPELQDRIFQPFVQLDPSQEGVGLGLATVKRLAEAHGGRVGVRSERGQGALFWFELPRAAVRERATTEPRTLH